MLLAIACALGGCAGGGAASGSFAMATGSSATVAFESIDGPPPQIFDRMVSNSQFGIELSVQPFFTPFALPSPVHWQQFSIWHRT